MTQKQRAMWLDILERAATTGGEQFLAVCLAAGAIVSLAGLPWEVALSTGAGAFLVALITSVISVLLKVHDLPYWIEVLRRVGMTFGQSLLGAMGADVIDVIHFHWVPALNVAALAAFFALVKCVLAPNAVDNLSPSLLHRKNVLMLKGRPQ